MKHILLQKALKYKKKTEFEEPIGFYFNNLIGAWINKNEQSFLVHSDNFLAISTKKEDIETGEDQKGQ